MSFVLYALLQEKSPPLSAEGLISKLNDSFGKNKSFSSKLEVMPFSKEKSVRLEWDGWSVILTYSEGAEVQSDSMEIAKRLGEDSPPGLELIDRRIHVFFADDKGREHTTQTVDVMQFLEEIDGALVFDPQQSKLLNAP